MRPLITLIIILFSITLMSQDGDLFQSAVQAYERQDYQKAITTYKSILDQDLSSTELHFNLGNAYYKNQELGKAILHFEKAARLSPSDSKVQQNLSIARSEVELEVLEVPAFFLLRFWRGCYSLLSSTVWVALQFVLGLLFLAGIYLWRLPSNPEKKLKGFKIAAVSLPLLLLCYFAGASASKHEQDSGSAIVTTETELVLEPHEGGEVLEELTPGVKVLLLDKVDVWYKVSLINKEQGWVRVENLGLI